MMAAARSYTISTTQGGSTRNDLCAIQALAKRFNPVVSPDKIAAGAASRSYPRVPCCCSSPFAVFQEGLSCSCGAHAGLFTCAQQPGAAVSNL